MSHIKTFFLSILLTFFIMPSLLYASAIDPDRTVLEFPQMPPIHRGFVKMVTETVDESEDINLSPEAAATASSDELEIVVAPSDTVHYTFHAMGQGRLPKTRRFLSCATIEGPTLCSGYARFKLQSDPDVTKNWVVKYFSMPVADKHIGRVAFEGLLPGTLYDFQIGYMTRFADVDDRKELYWGGMKTRQVVTPPAEPKNTCSFVYGSCNWIGAVGPLKVGRSKGSATFQAVANDINAHESEGGTDAFISLGDWVYLDGLGDPIAAKGFGAIMKRYHLVNRTRGARALFNTGIPLYQMWDDHERWNNSTAEIPESRIARAAAAKRAYDLFQRPQGADTPKNWYTINDNLEGFVMDLRSELRPLDKETIGAEQMQALKDWLSEPKREDRVKPVFMSTTALMLQGDPWEASPEQLGELLNYIKEKNIKYVAFFSGDIHVGQSGLWKYVTEDITEKNVYIFEGASSPIHQVFAGKASRLHDTLDLTESGGPVLSAEGKFSETTAGDHFTRVNINHDKKTVNIIKKDPGGRILVNELYNLETGEVEF